MNPKAHTLQIDKETLRNVAGPELQMPTRVEVMENADLLLVQGGDANGSDVPCSALCSWSDSVPDTDIPDPGTSGMVSVSRYTYL